MLILQTCPHPLVHPAHSRDHCAYRRLRTLLQELPSVHANTRLRDHARHIARSNAATRPVRVDASCILDHTHRSPERVRILILFGTQGREQAEYPSAGTDGAGDRGILRPYQPPQILAATSAQVIAALAATQRPHHHRIPRRTYAGRIDMAHTTWHGVGGLCCRLESG
jgi:hypothetical protein